MVGNIQGDLSGNVLVEFDYNNIILVDPNKTISNGKISERLVDHENLVTFVNLEAELLPRTKLAIGGSPTDNITTISIAKINFLKPTKGDYLTSGYYDELTGNNTLNKNGSNQIKTQVVETQNGNTPYIKQSLVSGEGGIDNGLLGITSINVKISSSFIPSVTIELEDVQGRALFQLGDNSPYAAFFNLPYPPFYLTMKGYYGQAIKYQLNLITFNAKFDSQSGNYKVSLEFQGYKFNILNEISMAYLLATPHMYSKRYNVSTPETSTGKNNLISQIVSEGGTEKIHEVYSEYKSPSKRILPDDFPELTFQELMNKLETFEKRIVETYSKVDVDPLTNIKNYKKELQNFFNKVYGGQGSWFSKNLNTKPYVKKGEERFYVFRDDIVSNVRREETISELKTIIDFYNKKLQENPTLGKKGTNEIKKQITYKTLTGTCSFDEVDIKKTYIEQTGIYSPTEQQLQKFVDDINNNGLFSDYIVSDPADPRNSKQKKQTYFYFEGVGKFNDIIRQIEAEANKILGEYEEKISADLATKIEDSNIGLGFRPSVRNIIAIIMANAEAFIRLLDDTHTKAWDVKYDPVRKSAILNNNSSAKGSDTKDQLQTVVENPSNSSNGKIPVYPWPQFFVETNEDKKGRFQLKYIGDPSIVQLTQGYNYQKWPEVEFVEEFLKGLAHKFSEPQYNPATDNQGFTSLLNVNAIEFPQTGLPYSNKEEIKFFYEIWERQFLTSHYSGLSRLKFKEKNELLDLLVDVETKNLVTTIGLSNPYLSSKLKNYGLSSNIYVNFLKTISNNGSGSSWQNFIRDFYVTPYINSLTKSEYSYSIIDINSLGKEPVNKISSEILENIVESSTTNEPNLTDIYPFTNETWCQTNLISSSINTGNEVFNTTNVLKVYQPKNIISNFTDLNDHTNNRPVTNFSYKEPTNPISEPFLSSNDYKSFYSLRKPVNFVTTEGYCDFKYENGDETPQLTTSMLNTPYFVNSILKGVDNFTNGDIYPYKESAYLFLNSLPLITLRERYKTDEPSIVGPTINNSVTSTLDSLDYMFASLKKFGAIHKLPYAWILKIGSVWHRYKFFKENGVDILSSVWRDFDYVNNFDPVTNNINKEYNVTVNGQPEKIRLDFGTTSSATVQSGFYPNLINKFNIFYNDTNLYAGYTDSDIQKSLNNGLKIYNFPQSNINNSVINNVTYFYKPWSVLLQSNVSANISVTNCEPTVTSYNDGYYIIPSFGGEHNQCQSALGGGTVGYSNNKSLYNGSVRMFWAAPIYGYFNTNQIQKPNIDSYIFKLKNISNDQVPFEILTSGDYTKMEELFSVFEKSILDSFEEEFLNFSKPLINQETKQKTYSNNQIQINSNDLYTNFQSLFRSLMLVPAQNNIEILFTDSISKQFSNFSKTISNFLEYDVIFRYGNPSNYDRRVFDSFLSSNLPTPTIVDPIVFNGYLNGSLPSNGGTQTLLNSKGVYVNEWNTLETYVGFSTIPELVYTDNGSYITDFFIDNNVEFTVDNIKTLSPLIKIYATQKLKNPTLTNPGFKLLINTYLNECKNLQDYSLNGVLNRLSKDLPNYDIVPEKTIQTVIDGQQSKVEAYESFKALNDKWISGSDFKTKTLFEDILFLDRASRNIGDTLLLDIFELKKIINQSSLSSQMNMSVYTFISGILIRNNFTVMNLPSYVNFYNVKSDQANIKPKQDGSLLFADNMWGTHLTVDTRESEPKMICFYVGKPSTYLDLPKGNYKFRNDGFELSRFSENPLIENITKKDDYTLSNRCVGFNVDIGIRNQNIFNNFTVSQENGKGTSESVNTTLNMINQSSGRNTATQSTGLYNLYKQRSYQAQVVSMGNALIQPTMYFNLRHVPMFNGPYMITEVSHVITPGTFQTTFVGTRQGMFDLPSIDSYLQSINRNLLTKLETAIKNRKPETPITRTDDKALGATVNQNSNTSPTSQDVCGELVLPVYIQDGYIATNTTTTQKTIKEFIDIITGTTKFSNLQGIIYSICYLNSFSNNMFNGNNNNFAVIDLQTDFGETSNFFLKTYSCLNTTNFTTPIANFERESDFIDFMVARLLDNIPRITSQGLHRYYICDFPTSTNRPNVSDFEAKKDTEYKESRDMLREGLINARNNGIDLGSDDKINLLMYGTTTSGQNTQNPQNNLNTTNTTIPTCPIPSILSISPITGNINDTVVTVNGNYLYNISTVTVNGQNCSFNIISNDKVNVTIPANLNGQIVINTDHGSVTSTQSFQYVTTTNTPSVNGMVVPQGQNPPTPVYSVTFTYIGDFATLQGNDESWYNVLKSTGRYLVLKINDSNIFTESNVDSVSSYNITDNLVPNTIETGTLTQNTNSCVVNNMSPNTYYWILKYRPNGAGTQPILTIRSDNWTQ